MPTLNTVFKQVFGEALEPLGFVKIKGKYPYFVRIVGDEIIHVITVRNERFKGEFSILGGVATVYRQCITLDQSPQDTHVWLPRILEYCRSNNSFKATDIKDTLFDNQSNTFYYKVDDVESLQDSIKRALKATEMFILPVLNRIVDLNLCLMYLRRYGGWLYIRGDDENFGNDYFNNTYNEGLLFIKTNYRGNFMETMKSPEEYVASYPYGFRGNNDSYDEYYEYVRRSASEGRAKLDGILDNPDKYAKALAELEHRKAANTKILRSYGLSI